LIQSIFGACGSPSTVTTSNRHGASTHSPARQEVIARGAQEARLLRGTQGLARAAVEAGTPIADLDEHQGGLLLHDDIDLAAPAQVVAVQFLEPQPAQVTDREVLRPPPSLLCLTHP